MIRILALLLLSLSLSYSLEVGIKLGNTRINWKGNDSTTMDWFVSLYGEQMFPLTTFIYAGPSLELGYGRDSIGLFYCRGYGLCRLDFVYTTVELNGKLLVNLGSGLSLYGGGGVSANRFGIDASDPLTNTNIGTLGDENTVGFQAFGGASVSWNRWGISLEYKRKSFNSDSISSSDTFTLNLFARF